MINKEHLGKLSVHFVCICLFESLFSAADRKSAATPEDVVQKFCELDAKGTRLTSETFNNIADLITWPEEGGENMVENMVVIDGFTVGKATYKNGRATVPVYYNNIGSTDFIDFSSPAPTTSSLDAPLNSVLYGESRI